jgi:hypothetical protein
MAASRTTDVKLPSNEEPFGPVTILDGNGTIVRIVPASEFRRDAQGGSTARPPRRRNPGAKRAA